MSLYEELKRRHVFKVAAAYAVVAWILIQVANVISGPMSLPDWFEPVVLALLVLGFPVALVLAWAFDLSPAPEKAQTAGKLSEDNTTPGSQTILMKGTSAVVLIGVIVAGGIWLAGAEKRHARTDGLAELDALVSASNWEQAYQKAIDLQEVIPESEDLQDAWRNFSWQVDLVSEPAGARLNRRAYRDDDNQWQPLGTTPLDDVRIPFGLSVIRAELEGHEPVLQVVGGSLFLTETLTPERYTNKTFLLAPEIMRMDPVDVLPEGTVRVRGWRQDIAGESSAFNDFFLDRFEVTNREFKEFVDAGGYERRELWEYPVESDDGELSWESAISRFVDRTNRFGPSTWQAGDFPDGTGDHPVSGISWYEAAAYARFRGKQLPSIHHWQRAFTLGAIAAMVPESNLETDSTVPVGSTKSMSWAGNFDMAGNVREWVFNAVGDRRFILGGAWNNDPYRTSDMQFRQPPLSRDPGNGLRLAIIRDEPETVAAATLPLQVNPARDIVADAQVSDEVFEAYRVNFEYDRTPLNATVESLESTRLTKHELVEIDAAYPSLRLPIHIYLPSNASPPYQVIVYWAGSIVERLSNYEDFKFQFDFLLKSGRAVAFPIYYGTFGRQISGQGPEISGTAAQRDAVERSIKDLHRTVDYLETRPDIDTGKIGYFGNSGGARLGLIGLTLDNRFRTSVFYTLPLSGQHQGSLDVAKYLTRFRTPVLLVSGEYDPVVALNEVGKPGFDLIGTPDEDKRMVVAPGGHFVPYDLLVSESLAWFDRYLGEPVKR